MTGLLVSAVFAFVVSAASPSVIIPQLLRHKVLDIPNERSSHQRPAVRGVGLAPLFGLVAGLALFVASTPGFFQATFFILVPVVILAGGIGFLEDSRGLPVGVRAGLQILLGVVASVAIVLYSAQSWWLVGAFAIWIAAYLNIANFMDGIDGLSGVHGVVVGSFFGILGFVERSQWLSGAGWIIAAVFLGFLPWNVLRRGTFLGDAGSYLLGTSIAIVAAMAVASGVSILVVLSPLALYLFDTGSTLARRVFRRERWFEAHRSHVYQQLTKAGLPHLSVALIIGFATALTAGGGLLVAVLPDLWPVLVVTFAVVLTSYLGLARILTKLGHDDEKGMALR